MAKKKKVAVLIYHVPPALKGAIEEEAVERGTSASEVAVAILAAKFGMEYEPRPKTNQNPVPVEPNATILYLMMPRGLRHRLQTKAPNPVRYTEFVRAILLEHYNLAPVA